MGLGALDAAPARAQASSTGVVYTANEQGHSVSALNLATGQVKTTPVKIAPHNLQVSADGRLLLSVGMSISGGAGHASMRGMSHGQGAKKARGRLLILDAAKPSAWGISGVKVGSSPAHVVVDRQNRRAYVTNGGDGTLSVVDIARRKIIRIIKTGNMPHGLRFSPNGREIYVANTGDGSVSVINVASDKEVKRIPVGKAPVQVGFTPDGRRAYISLRDANSVAVVDTARRRKIATVKVGRNPIQVFAAPNGREIYVANQGNESNPDNKVSVINTTTNRVVATIVTGKGAHGVVVSSDGKRVFIANTFADTVSIIDTATHKVLRNVAVGKGPGGITFSGTTFKSAAPPQ